MQQLRMMCEETPWLKRDLFSPLSLDRILFDLIQNCRTTLASRLGHHPQRPKIRLTEWSKTEGPDGNVLGVRLQGKARECQARTFAVSVWRVWTSPRLQNVRGRADHPAALVRKDAAYVVRQVRDLSHRGRFPGRCGNRRIG
jgi:hypothetical protein